MTEGQLATSPKVHPVQEGNFHGLPTHIISNAHLKLEFLRDAGPRIVRLIPAAGNANLFAETPHIRLPSPYGPYPLYGGHRLWIAPENPSHTYAPENGGVTIEATENGATVHRPAGPHSPIAKTLSITLHHDRPAVTVRHTLRNDGNRPLQLAAWAITQLPPQGVAILPQRTTPADENGMLPNRQLTLWPYTRWSDPRLELHDDLILVHGRADMPRHFKIGIMNHAGWVAYLGQSYLFVKIIQPQPDQPHADMGCNTELYTDDGFVELETLSPLTHLAPGCQITHEERWEVRPAPDVAPTAAALRALIDGAHLPTGAATHAPAP